MHLGGEFVGAGAALVGAVSWALTSSLMAYGVRYSSPVLVNVLRLSIASLLLLPMLLVFLWSAFPGPADLAALWGSTLLGAAIGDSLYAMALRSLGQATALPVSNGLSPLATFALAAVFLNESVGPFSVAGAGLVIGGSWIVLRWRVRGEERHSGEHVLPGVAQLLTAVACWTASALWLKTGLEEVNLVGAVGLRAPVYLLLTPVVWTLFRPSEGTPLRTALNGPALVSALATAANIFLFVVAVAEAGAGRATLLFSTSPLAGIVLSAALLKERITAPLLVGTGVVMVGVGLVLAG